MSAIAPRNAAVSSARTTIGVGRCAHLGAQFRVMIRPRCSRGRSRAGRLDRWVSPGPAGANEARADTVGARQQELLEVSERFEVGQRVTWLRTQDLCLPRAGARESCADFRVGVGDFNPKLK
jgi:hypothetical protein